VATSVDGFIARTDHTFDCFPMEGAHVDDYLETLKAYDTVVMGRRTYEVGLRAGVSDPYPWMDTWVFSRTLGSSPSPRVRVVAEDPTLTVRRLEEGDGGPIYLCGGGALASSLFAAGLVDSVWVKLNPMVLGDGVPFAPGLRAQPRLTLTGTERYDSGVVLLRYDVG